MLAVQTASTLNFKIPRRKILNLVVEFRIREIIKFYSQTMRAQFFRDFRIPRNFKGKA